MFGPKNLDPFVENKFIHKIRDKQNYYFTICKKLRSDSKYQRFIEHCANFISKSYCALRLLYHRRNCVISVKPNHKSWNGANQIRPH